VKGRPSEQIPKYVQKKIAICTSLSIYTYIYGYTYAAFIMLIYEIYGIENGLQDDK
jgi:hypothetical protein